MSEKIVINGQICDRSEFDTDKDTSDSYIYDVVRVIDGRPLFAQEHYARLARSLEMAGHPVPLTLDDLYRLIAQLFDANGMNSDNVKLIVDHFDKGSGCDVYLFRLHADYPSAEAYAKGVPTELFVAMRDNPQVKFRNQELRDATNDIIRKHRLFEVILVDNDGNITEGSRSNIFFIKNGSVYTSPADGVLLGITRQKIIEICRDNDIPVIEMDIPADSIGDFAAAFISGTSPKVLPIRNVGDVTLNVNEKTLRRIMGLFDQEIEKL